MAQTTDAPRVTVRHLRADDQACARRITSEMYQRPDTKRNFGASRSFDVAARLLGDISLAHGELRAGTLADFPDPADLTAEERQVYRAAARGYVAIFPDAFALDPLVDEWESVDESAGLRWTARVPLAGRDAEGRARVRHIGISRQRQPPLDSATLFMLALRTAGWAEEVLVDVGVLLDADRLRPVLIDSATRSEARSWAIAHTSRWIGLEASARPRIGRDCLGCSYVAGCAAHSG